MGDVKLYVAPSGPGEQAMRQNIDRRVRDLFLQMLGVGWDPKNERFVALQQAGECDEDPAGHKLLRVGKIKNQKFDKITWVSHSLGTVVSYNVLGDLFCTCQKLRKDAEDNRNPVPEEIKRIEAGLHRFYTLGSPLRKIQWLFPNNMRPWPVEYFEKYILDNKGLPLKKNGKPDASQWWLNFRHIWDPVSGPVNRSEMFHWAGDWHSPEVLTLPGVARKTANVLLGTWFKKNEGVVVDTHVHRISRRLELTKSDDPKNIEQDLMKIIPRERWTDFSHEVIWHGRRLCVARSPKCAECPLEDICHAADKTWSTVEIHKNAK